MKRNLKTGGSRRGLYAVLAIAALVAIVIGSTYLYIELRKVYLERCVVTDMERQVHIADGRMVKGDVIAEIMGLKNGVNLALVDFARKREELLRRVPTLREVVIVRREPDEVTVTAEERVPVARMNLRGNRAVTGRVVDIEGMVFPCQRGTQALPVIRETRAPGTPVGKRIDGRALAALVLIDACRNPGFSELQVLEVDVSRTDYLLVTFADYSRAKISWEGMDAPLSASARAALESRLDHLAKAVRSQVVPSVKTWNVTMPDLVFADTQEK